MLEVAPVTWALMIIIWMAKSFHIGTVGGKSLNLDKIIKIIQSAPANEPLFLSVFAGYASNDVCSKVKKFCEELKNQNDGKQYFFVRSMDLAATYRAWKGLPVK